MFTKEVAPAGENKSELYCKYLMNWKSKYGCINIPNSS